MTILPESILLMRCTPHTWEDPEICQIRAQNQANQNNGPQKTQVPQISDWNYHQAHDCQSPPVYIRTYVYPHGLTVLFLLVNTWLVSQLSIFVGIIFCKAEDAGPFLSLTTSLVARIWCFHCLTQSNLWLVTQPHSSHGRLKPPKITLLQQP